MIIELKDTTAAKISSAMVKARRRNGSPAMGMVLTMIVVTDQRAYPRVLDAALEAGREHPSRILLVVTGTSRRAALNAEVRIGEGIPGELVVLRMSGELAEHPDSVVLPLLLPDSPVVAWWPGKAPLHPGEDPLGRLASRRITDAMGTRSPLRALEDRAANHSPGDSDLTWTRLTPWRALLAAALDQYPATIVGATVGAARDNAPANLLAAWLESRLDLDVRRITTGGPGITAVRLTTAAGDIAIERQDGLLASYSVPGQPQRLVALKRRDIPALITEELRRMDADDIFEAAAQVLIRRTRRAAARRSGPKQKSAKKPAAKGAPRLAGARSENVKTKKPATKGAPRLAGARSENVKTKKPAAKGAPRLAGARSENVKTKKPAAKGAPRLAGARSENVAPTKSGARSEDAGTNKKAPT